VPKTPLFRIPNIFTLRDRNGLFLLCASSQLLFQEQFLQSIRVFFMHGQER